MDRLAEVITKVMETDRDGKGGKADVKGYAGNEGTDDDNLE